MARFAEIPGTPTPAHDTERAAAMVRGLADAYETNPAFHGSFGSADAARFAARALHIHVDPSLDESQGRPQSGKEQMR